VMTRTATESFIIDGEAVRIDTKAQTIAILYKASFTTT